MSTRLFDARDILSEFKPKTWFAIVNGVEHTIKELGTLMRSQSKISFKTNVREFKKRVGKYEFTIITYVTRQSQKNPTLQAHVQAAGADAAGSVSCHRAQDLGRSAWLRDAFGKLEDQEYLQSLDPRSLSVCIYLQMACDGLALRKSDQLFDGDITSLLQ